MNKISSTGLACRKDFQLLTTSVVSNNIEGTLSNHCTRDFMCNSSCNMYNHTLKLSPLYRRGNRFREGVICWKDTALGFWPKTADSEAELITAPMLCFSHPSSIQASGRVCCSMPGTGGIRYKQESGVDFSSSSSRSTTCGFGAT